MYPESEALVPKTFPECRIRIVARPLPKMKRGGAMSDGREERQEREKRIEQEKREDREDRIDRDDPEEWAPERPIS